MTDSKDLKEPVYSHIENTGTTNKETVQGSKCLRPRERRKVNKLQTLVEDANEAEECSMNSASDQSKHEPGEVDYINDN